MGVDNELVCLDCEEYVPCVARNGYLHQNTDNIRLVNAFMIKHADHHLVFAADDNWARSPKGSRVFTREEAEVITHRSVYDDPSANPTKPGLKTLAMISSLPPGDYNLATLQQVG